MNPHELAEKLSTHSENQGHEDVTYTLRLPSGAYATVTVVVTAMHGEDQ